MLRTYGTAHLNRDTREPETVIWPWKDAVLLKAPNSGGRTTAFPSRNGYRCPVSAAHDPEPALANVPRQDADCVGLIGVNVYGSAARMEFTVARRTRGA
jgi:hypothetical protein